tara:strand:+ start:1694 stop:1867 length:174 start_codon:yes stop_codon:yes gene_type:complete
MLKKAVLNYVAGKLIKKFRLDKILKYVEEDNELDDSVRFLKIEMHEIKIRLEKLESE